MESKKLKFKVVYASGEDPSYPSSELNQHTRDTKGWQTTQFCDYPQELIFELESYAQISQIQILSHQSKISTKIELYVGVGSDYTLARFRRLGYLSLDPNVRSEYKARELKSVFVNCEGQFIKFLVHKSYNNDQNLYNQVGIVAVNFLGEPKPNPAATPSVNEGIMMSNNNITPSSVKPMNRVDDLAVDMHFDKDVANILNRVSEAKKDAVAREDYPEAKKLKILEDELKGLGIQISKLELAKKISVEQEDYDKAAQVKEDIQKLRDEIQAKISDIPIFQQPLYPPPQQTPIMSQGTPSSQYSQYSQQQQQPPYQQSYHSTPTVRSSYQVQSTPGSSYNNQNLPPSYQPTPMSKTPQSSYQQQPPPSEYDEFPPPQQQEEVQQQQQYNNNNNNGEYYDEKVDDDENNVSEPSAMKPYQRIVEEHRPDSRPVGKLPPYRQTNFEKEPSPKQAITSDFPLSGVAGAELLDEPDEIPDGKKGEVGKWIELVGEYIVRCIFSKAWNLRSAGVQKIAISYDEYNKYKGDEKMTIICDILKTTYKDKMAQVYLSSIDLFDQMIRNSKDYNDKLLISTIDPLIKTLVDKLGDNNQRIHQKSYESLLKLCDFIEPSIVSNLILKPLKTKNASVYKPLLGRLELLKAIIEKHGLNEKSGLTLELVMNYLKNNNTFEHPKQEMREIAREICLLVSSYTSSDAVIPFLNGLRKNVISEISALLEDNDNNLEINENQLPSQSIRARQVNVSDGVQKSTMRPPTAQPDHYDSKDDELRCQFCDYSDPQFTEELLDEHYLYDCPMLIVCALCDQVIEISHLNEHLTTECTVKDRPKLCPRCKEAIQLNKFDEHVKRGTCRPAKHLTEANRCPLCHADIGPGDEGWKAHLRDGTGCPYNDRTNSNA